MSVGGLKLMVGIDRESEGKTLSFFCNLRVVVSCLL